MIPHQRGPSDRQTSTPLRADARPCIAAGGVLAAFVMLSTVGVAGAGVALYVDDLATVVVAALAALSCASAARRNEGRARWCWRLLAAAWFAWTAGQVAWCVYDLLLDGVPAVSVADGGFLVAIVLAVVALVVHPGAQESAGDRLRAAFDGLTLAVALLFLSWTTIIEPVWSAHDVTTGAGVVSLAYPFGDVVVIFLLIRALRSLTGPDRASFAWILIGLLAISASDSGYTYLTAVRGYESGNAIDVGWFAGFIAIALGGWYGRSPQRACVRRSSAATQTLAVVLPFVPVLLALGVLTVRAKLGRSIDTTSLVLAFSLIGSVLVRQVIALTAQPPAAGRIVEAARVGSGVR